MRLKNSGRSMLFADTSGRNNNGKSISQLKIVLPSTTIFIGGWSQMPYCRVCATTSETALSIKVNFYALAQTTALGRTARRSTPLMRDGYTQHD